MGPDVQYIFRKIADDPVIKLNLKIETNARKKK